MGGRVTAIAFVLLALLTFAGIDSSRNSFLFQFLTPAGHLQAIGTDRTGIVVFFSDIPFGREMGLSVDAWRISADEAERFHQFIYEPPAGPWLIPTSSRPHFAGFYWANDVWNMSPSQTANYKALLIPYWFLLSMLAIPMTVVARRSLIKRLRRRQGKCTVCGYDLRHSIYRCPECGTLVAPRRDRRPHEIRAVVPRIFCSSPFLVIAICIAIVLLLRPNAHPVADASLEENAQLNVIIPEFVADGIAFDEALNRLAQISGAEIVKSATVATRQWSTAMHAGGGGGLAWRKPVFGIFQNLPLSTILRVLTGQVRNEFPVPLTFAPRDDGTVLIGTDDEMPYVARIFDLRIPYYLLNQDRTEAERKNDFVPHEGLDADIQLIFDEQSAYEVYSSPAFPPLFFVGGRVISIGPRSRQLQNQSVARQLMLITERWPSGFPVHIHRQFSDYWNTKSNK